jgi:hypothetical protein
MKVATWLLGGLLPLLAGCASYSGDAGVENTWRSKTLPSWEAGVTTESDITDRLGPPSQVIGLEDETVYYYLRERKQGKGLILLVYNWGYQKTVYDRAIFFFDEDGRLIKHSYSPEALPYDEAR